MSEILEKSLLIVASFIGFLIVFPLFSPVWSALPSLHISNSTYETISNDVISFDRNIERLNNISVQGKEDLIFYGIFNFEGIIACFFNNNSLILTLYFYNQNLTIFQQHNISISRIVQIFRENNKISMYQYGISNETKFLKLY